MGLSCVEFSPFLQLVSSHSSDGNERTWGDNESWLGATMNRLGATVMLAWGDNERTWGDNVILVLEADSPGLQLP